LGYKSIYINKAYGHGIMPLNFEGLKKQRFRWCFGGIQILRKHWEALMPWAGWLDPANHLTAAQRYYYLLSSLQWFNEAITLGFTAMVLFGSIAIVFGWDTGVRPWAGVIAVIPLILLVLGVGRFLWALRNKLKLSVPQALRAMGSFFSLSWVVTLASIQGLIQPRGVFLRTSKSKGASNLLRALVVTQWETCIGIVCGLTGLFLAVSRPSFEGWFTVMFLFWQMSLYLAAPVYSLLSEWGATPLPVTSAGDIDGRVVQESQAARWSVALVTLLLIGFLIFNFVPQPTGLSAYAYWAPAELKPEKVFKVHPVKDKDKHDNGNPNKP
jgi:hypothetical protein